MPAGWRSAALLGLLLGLARPAGAQWYEAEGTGINHTRRATVVIRAGPSFTLDFHDVLFEARPFQYRRDYFVRVGYLFRRHPQHGVEIEWWHFKAIARTDQAYPVTIGPDTPLTVADVTPMDNVVQRYAMNSGVNLLSAVWVRRVVWRPRVAWVTRVGGGLTIPYASTELQGVNVRHYELGGPGAKAAVGVEWTVVAHAALTADYQVTWARPVINVAGGRAWTTLLTQHLSVGLRVAWGKP